MKVLVSDKLGEVGVQMFRDEEGVDVDVKTDLTPEELKGIIGEYDALVIRSATKVTADLLEAAGNLKVVGRAGIGLDNVKKRLKMLYPGRHQLDISESGGEFKVRLTVELEE